MKYINLIDKLTTEDKMKINLYINKYGCNLKDFIGIDKWLENWSHANQKLYHLLGDTFIREFPYQYEKDEHTLFREINDLLHYSQLKRDYHDFYWDVVKRNDWFDTDSIMFFNHLLDEKNFANEKIEYSLKFKKPEAKRMLQIQAGTKPIKAIGRVLEYFKDDFDFDMEGFESFKKKYAIILSEKIVKGRFCISIHPMDFMTMSDNAANWTSCMSWVDNGCYHVGTIEMMNSNNVACAYLLNDNSNFVFDKTAIDKETGEILGTWNNKRWRQLFYITKDIIMSGKPYPYVSKEMSLAILEKIKELASENMNWDYEYGPELYQDMEHIDNIWHMDQQRAWMHVEKKKPMKKNIIWDTKGMYNDMINDHYTKYWCYRNKVKGTKIISVSGKAPCLCCGESILKFNEDYEDYNDRYYNTGAVVCDDCLETKYTCSCCRDRRSNIQLFTLKDGRHICKDCLRFAKICPCCGEIYFATWHNEGYKYMYNNYLYEIMKEKDTAALPDPSNRRYRSFSTYDPHEWSSIDDIDKELKEVNVDRENPWDDSCYFYMPVERFCLHEDCEAKIIEEFKEHSIRVKYGCSWSRHLDEFFVVDPAIGEKYRNFNLVAPLLGDIIMPEKSVSA